MKKKKKCLSFIPIYLFILFFNYQTGAIHGYGYVEFLVPGVAEVAAKAMNGYFVKGKLIKCKYIIDKTNTH